MVKRELGSHHCHPQLHLMEQGEGGGGNTPLQETPSTCADFILQRTQNVSEDLETDVPRPVSPLYDVLQRDTQTNDIPTNSMTDIRDTSVVRNEEHAAMSGRTEEHVEQLCQDDV